MKHPLQQVLHISVVSAFVVAASSVLLYGEKPIRGNVTPYLDDSYMEDPDFYYSPSDEEYEYDSHMDEMLEAPPEEEEMYQNHDMYGDYPIDDDYPTDVYHGNDEDTFPYDGHDSFYEEEDVYGDTMHDDVNERYEEEGYEELFDDYDDYDYDYDYEYGNDMPSAPAGVESEFAPFAPVAPGGAEGDFDPTVVPAAPSGAEGNFAPAGPAAPTIPSEGELFPAAGDMTSSEATVTCDPTMPGCVDDDDDDESMSSSSEATVTCDPTMPGCVDDDDDDDDDESMSSSSEATVTCDPTMPGCVDDDDVAAAMPAAPARLSIPQTILSTIRSFMMQIYGGNSAP